MCVGGFAIDIRQGRFTREHGNLNCFTENLAAGTTQTEDICCVRDTVDSEYDGVSCLVFCYNISKRKVAES